MYTSWIWPHDFHDQATVDKITELANKSGINCYHMKSRNWLQFEWISAFWEKLECFFSGRNIPGASATTCASFHKHLPKQCKYVEALRCDTIFTTYPKIQSSTFWTTSVHVVIWCHANSVIIMSVGNVGVYKFFHRCDKNEENTVAHTL